MEPIVRDEDDSEDGLDTPVVSECDGEGDREMEEDVTTPVRRR